MKYDHQKIEKKWQAVWIKKKIHQASDTSSKPKYYSLFEFPYPSGDGLHVGHLRPYVGMDVVGRKRRMEGYNVLYPIGWDSFGLPTENYAIKHGIDPAVATKQNTKNFKRQMQSIGLSLDWSREIDTTDPAYYKWTQWMFLKFFEHGLAYKAKTLINWCPKDKIGLANEEAAGGMCDRCGGPVEKREKEQWLIRITDYADKLLEGLKEVDYIPQAKIQQENWIGRKEGIEITYPIENSDKTVTVFTTRPDTNFGATFVVLAPDHALVSQITTPEQLPKVQAYVQETVRTSEQERIAEGRRKTGAFTGRYAVNHLTGKKMPVWISDFVLSNFGTGAIVGVPGHDLRDFEFAKEFGLEIVRVVIGPDKDESAITDKKQVQEESGTMINSGFLDGLDIHAATKKIMDHIEQKGWGKRKVTYKLRDWIFSRQRYWGEPIPLVHCEKDGWVPVLEKDLPVKLPKVKNYQPRDDGQSPLASVESWVKTKCPTCKGPARRETDTMPNWAGSSWYFLRYIDPKNKKAFADPGKLKHWMPVDWYNGGMEHTVLHLLYSRFWNMFLHERGLVPTMEPYKKRTSHALILAEGGVKMSKSKGNVISPDTLTKEFGADALRLYEMFIGPFTQSAAWDQRGILGCARFLEKVWKIGEKIENRKQNIESDGKVTQLLHKTIKKVGDDIESMNFNTAVSAMMIYVNELANSKEQIAKSDWQKFLTILSPFAPHITEELNSQLPAPSSKLICEAAWPEVDTSLLVEDTFELIIQVNGRVRGKVLAQKGIQQPDAESLALAVPDIKKWITTTPKKVVFIADRLINFLV